jgi:prepilin-type processing-associated H-X9-DG protein
VAALAGVLPTPSTREFQLLPPVIGAALAAVAAAVTPTARTRHRSIAALALCAALLLAPYALPSGSKRERYDGRVRCAANLRQIGTSIIMYANDHRGALPPDWSTLLVVQELTPELFICPSSNDDKASGATPDELLRDFKKHGRCSYVYVGTAPPIGSARRFHVLAYEPLANHAGKGIHVLYADGRVVWHDADRATRLIADLQAGINPPRP